MLTHEQCKIYSTIDLFDRYKSLSSRFNSKDVLEEIEKELVLQILKDINSTFFFNQKEGFFGLSEQEGDINFKLNLSLKFGMVEPIIWAKNKSTEEQFGGALLRVTKLIQLAANSEKVERIMYPRYNSYEDLKRIAEQLYGIYYDFKKIVVSKEGK